MDEWFAKNSWSIIIALVTLVSTYSIYGYKINQLEAQASEISENMKIIQEILQNVAVISTKIESVEGDIEEIKQEVKEVNKKI